MTHGGYRDERDEWPPRRPRHAPPDDRYETDDPPAGPSRRARHSDAAKPEPDAPFAGGVPWYGQRTGGAPYGGRPEPSYERYPDAYVVDPDGYLPPRPDPASPYAAGQPDRPPMAPPPHRDPAHNGLADHRAFGPDGRLRRPAPADPQAGSPPAASAGPDVRGTGQLPIFGSDAPTARPQPRQPYPIPRQVGQQPRAFEADTRATGEEFRAFGTDPRTTGTQPRLPAGDPWTTGGQQRVPDFDPRATGTQHRVDPPRGRRRVVVAVVASIIVLLAVGAAAVVVLVQRDSTSAAAAGASARPSIDTTAIADRKVDPAPLTKAEVFGAGSVPSSASGGSYRVVRSEADTSCGDASTAAISVLLASLGCNQAVRATMLSPDQAYVITAGIMNLPSAASASKAAGSIQADIAGGKGRFNGLAAGGNTDVVAAAQARVAWDTRGHYLIYSVIVLTNGNAIAASDSRVPLIITDVVEDYLGDKVLRARADASAAPTPSAS